MKLTDHNLSLTLQGITESHLMVSIVDDIQNHFNTFHQSENATNILLSFLSMPFFYFFPMVKRLRSRGFLCGASATANPSRIYRKNVRSPMIWASA